MEGIFRTTPDREVRYIEGSILDINARKEKEQAQSNRRAAKAASQAEGIGMEAVDKVREKSYDLVLMDF